MQLADALPATGGELLLEELRAEEEQEELSQPMLEVTPDPAVVEALGPAAVSVRSLYEPTASETTLVFAERLADQCDALGAAGVSEGAVQVSAFTEAWARKTFLEFKRQGVPG